MNKIKSINFATIYVDDYSKALAFYEKHFGYEVKYNMGEQSSWGKAGEAGIYIEGGKAKADVSVESVRASVVFNVGSAFEFFSQLKADGVKMVQTEPVNMGADDYWFQFQDPSGNILEILGSR